MYLYVCSLFLVTLELHKNIGSNLGMLTAINFGIVLVIVFLITALCIVGNKIDLPKDMRKVSTEKGREYANSLGALFAETSAARDVGKGNYTHVHTRTHSLTLLM